MTSDPMMLGAVSVQYDDYLGTAAADDADAMLGARSLYQMVGLDREQWLIVSVELARSKVSERVSIYAIDRYQYPLRGLAELQERPDFAYGIPVVAFDLPSSVSVDRFVAEAFQRVSVRLVSQAVGGQNLAVTDRRPVDDQLQSDELTDHARRPVVSSVLTAEQSPFRPGKHGEGHA